MHLGNTWFRFEMEKGQQKFNLKQGQKIYCVPNLDSEGSKLSFLHILCPGFFIVYFRHLNFISPPFVVRI